VLCKPKAFLHVFHLVPLILLLSTLHPKHSDYDADGSREDLDTYSLYVLKMHLNLIFTSQELGQIIHALKNSYFEVNYSAPTLTLRDGSLQVISELNSGLTKAVLLHLQRCLRTAG
jgi:hypothetical protein